MNEAHPSSGATALGVLSLLLWSSTVGSYRVVAQALGTVGAAAVVFLGAGLLGLLLPLLGRRRKTEERRRPFAYWIACGGFFVTYVLSFHLAVGLARGTRQVLEVGLLNYLWPCFTIVFSVLVLGRRVRWPLVPGLCLALGGLLLAVGGALPLSAGAFFENAWSNRLAYGLALLGALAWGAYNNASRRFGGEGGGGVPHFMLLSGALLLLLRCFVTEPMRWSNAVGFELAYLIVFPTFLAYSLWETGMRRGHMTLLASLAYLIPVASTAYSSLRLGLLPGRELWLACGLIVLGALACRAGVIEEGGAMP